MWHCACVTQGCRGLRLTKLTLPVLPWYNTCTSSTLRPLVSMNHFDVTRKQHRSTNEKGKNENLHRPPEDDSVGRQGRGSGSSPRKPQRTEQTRTGQGHSASTGRSSQPRNCRTSSSWHPYLDTPTARQRVNRTRVACDTRATHPWPSPGRPLRTLQCRSPKEWGPAPPRIQ